MEQDADAAAADGFVGVESRDMDQNGAAEPVLSLFTVSKSLLHSLHSTRPPNCDSTRHRR